MNDEQQLQETLIEFLGDVFGVTQQLIQKSGITKRTKQNNPQEWNKYVTTFQKQLGMNSTPMAKLGGILNYINKLNTIR